MRAAEIAERLSARLAGDSEVEILGVAPLDRATGSDLSFLSNSKYRETARVSAAGAILVGEGESLPGRTLIVCADPYVAFAKALRMFHKEPEPPKGVHPTAVLGEGCHVDATASLGPYVVIGAGASVGPRCILEAGCAVGRGCQLGPECHLYPGVTLYDRTLLGERVILHAGVVVGSDGFGYAQERGRHLKIPQVGRVVIEHDVEVGANTTIDRGTLEETRIGQGTKIDNLVQVAHNVTTGPDCILVAQSGISGSTSLGRSVIFAGQSGAVGHIHIGDGARVGAKSAVTKDVPKGAFVTGHPASEHRLWLKERALSARLEEMLRRIKRLEDARPAAAREEDEP